MATKKSVSKKATKKKATPGKATKKASSKKAASKELISNNKLKPKEELLNTKEELAKEEIPEKESLAPDTGLQIPAQKGCLCMQKKPNGKFYCYKLIQGRWVQSSGISFPTKEICEDACC